MRQYIADALLSLMEHHDFASITVNQIVTKAGVHRSTYYRHFNSKEDVIRYFFHRIINEYLQEHAASTHDFIQYTTGFYEHFLHYKKQILLIHRSGMSILLHDVFTQLLHGKIGKNKTLTEQYRTHFQIGGTFNLFMFWFSRGMKDSAEDMAGYITEILPSDYTPYLMSPSVYPLHYTSGSLSMHYYTARSVSFYTDLSDLLLLLSIGFTNPDSTLAAGLTDGSYFNDLHSCLDGVTIRDLSPSSALEALSVCSAACLNQDTEEVRHRINREYSRLFTNPRQELIPIYESLLVHRGEAVSMFVNATCMHAEQTYRHNDFPFEEKNKVPGDHIAIELRYLAYLFAAYLNAVQASNSASRQAVETALEDFCSSHVKRWIASFAGEIKTFSNEPFYLLLAEVLEFIQPILLL